MCLKIYCWVGIVGYCVLSVGDLMLTHALLRFNGSAYESNPIAAACLDQYGWQGLALYKAGGVFVFVGAVALIVRRKPVVSAVLVTAGCAVLFSVTKYSHDLLVLSHREFAELHEMDSHPPQTHSVASDSSALPLPEQCWFSSP